MANSLKYLEMLKHPLVADYSPISHRTQIFLLYGMTRIVGLLENHQTGEHITIPENTHVVVTMDSSISVNGYKKLTIPTSSSLTLDIEYFKLMIESLSILGSLQLGPENRLIFNPYSPTIRTYTPLYLDVQYKNYSGKFFN